MSLTESDIKQPQVSENGRVQTISRGTMVSQICILRGKDGASLMKTRIMEGHLKFLRVSMQGKNNLIRKTSKKKTRNKEKHMDLGDETSVGILTIFWSWWHSKDFTLLQFMLGIAFLYDEVLYSISIINITIPFDGLAVQWTSPWQAFVTGGHKIFWNEENWRQRQWWHAPSIHYFASAIRFHPPHSNHFIFRPRTKINIVTLVMTIQTRVGKIHLLQLDKLRGTELKIAELIFALSGQSPAAHIEHVSQN